MADEIDRALAVVREATPGPWEVREHEELAGIAWPRGWVMDGDPDASSDAVDARAIALLRNCGEELLEVLRWSARVQHEGASMGTGASARYIIAKRRLHESTAAALTRLRECLPEEVSDG